MLDSSHLFPSVFTKVPTKIGFTNINNFNMKNRPEQF